MLRSIEKIKGYAIQAADGEIGGVDELFFDGRRWRVRYLVVDVGNWLLGRQVLIAPAAVSQINPQSEQIFLSLTQNRIENSPEVSAAEPISRQKERALFEYYQWQPYWTAGIHDPIAYGPFSDTMAGVFFPRIEVKKDEEEKVAISDEESHLRSTAEVSGYHIQAKDGEIGQVTDFLFDDENWAVRHLVVDTGTWLPGRKVLVAPPWIERIDWAERKVYVALTQESVRQSPSFDPQLLDIKNYEKQLLEHYRSWFSYLLEENNDQGEANMFLGKDIIGNPVITVSDGSSIGKARDVYLTNDCQKVAAIYLGTEGIFSRQSFLVKSEDVITIGKDAVLVKHGDVIHEETDLTETEEEWLRRDELQGRAVDTPGGTKVGRVGDVVIDKDGKVLGFSLSTVYVSGPINDNRSVAIHTVQDVGHEDGKMTIDLKHAEQQELNVT